MDERLFEFGILEPITVLEEVIVYNVNPNWGKRYLGVVAK